MDPKTKEIIKVSDVLSNLHPSAKKPESYELQNYKELPDIPTIVISEDNVFKVAAKLHGGAGPGGVDSLAL